AVLTTDSAILKIIPPPIRVEPAISINDHPPETATATVANSSRRLLSLTENEEAHIRMVLSHTGGRIFGARGAAQNLRPHSSTHASQSNQEAGAEDPRGRPSVEEERRFY